ncbi:streptogrisin C [Streptoalloteichus tenebrarius]|uniref:Streptogrisin C n=1 Tax=Streptoalloteichus tenebrarius (strain ATCC 17920 / DSM 40477 / JCM 4838 / CBS 697.72 / NBRC 16177 / NCIMB 11028 / NRRL B-12390 / A12253. 1 / ISP 5477) TaxID=1933 RepID=A0ABT1I0Q3_STRSD|nr:S1 family peptidase [Streptoalloteichus tenebrarius]MCP2261372.1 streptogrisin C [Streptoalloteichus tenebrarius]BFF00913.1 hypothetical protein GCM10020241_25880 [Streptoalloteichus tenebrarius]
MSARTRLRGRTLGVAATLAALSAAALTGAGGTAAAAPAEQLSGGQLAAVDYLSGKGVDRTEAVRRVLAQEGQTRTATQLAERLGGRMAGAYLDQGSGALVVNVTDDGAADEVRRTGATAKKVDRGVTDLNAAKARLDAAGKSAKGASWYVDVPNNQVVVQVPTDEQAGVTDLLRTAESLGGAARVERVEGRATTQAANLYGGQQIEFSVGGNSYVCSVGFNATDRYGRAAMITAGHCADGIDNGAFYRNGTYLGTAQAHSFPGNDYAYSTIDTRNWAPQGAVSQYNGYAVRVAGASQAPVGTTVCKSGRTTGWTCGQIQAYNVSVNYDNGDGTTSTVSGLVRSNTCTEGGDSGGSWIAGNYAQGVTSGGVGYRQNGKTVCGEKVGQPNVAYYQPIGEILSTYGLTLRTS